MFQKAVKRNARLRLALCGPAGSGKSYSALALAKSLGGPIAAIDTEHGSLSKYADIFEFDAHEPDTYDPRELVKAIKFAADNEYNVFIVDSLSHYWMGKGGELDLVDAVSKKSSSNNSFAAWKTVTPYHNELVDTLLSAKIHIICTMRTKTEWVLERDEKTGKNVPRKIGLAPIMRDGIEFEFDVCGDLDQENTLVVTKSRCPALSGKVINQPGHEMGETLKEWLSGAPEIEKPKPEDKFVVAMNAQIERLGEETFLGMLNGMGFDSLMQIPESKRKETYKTFAAYQPQPKAVFEATDDDIPKEMGGAWTEPKVDTAKPWKTMKQFLDLMAGLKAFMGDDAYYEVLRNHGLEHANEAKSTETAVKIYAELKRIETIIKTEDVA